MRLFEKPRINRNESIPSCLFSQYEIQSNTKSNQHRKKSNHNDIPVIAMKSATIIRNTLLSSQVLFPATGSSAFVVGMRSRRDGPPAVPLHSSASASSPTAQMASEDDYEFDFIAAATQAAVEREAREAPSNPPSSASASASTTPSGTASMTPNEASPIPAVVPPANEDDCVFDFIAAATQAAVEREAREAEAEAEAEAATSSFAVYPAFGLEKTVERFVGETR